jgi:hypothetical protein
MALILLCYGEIWEKIAQIYLDTCSPVADDYFDKAPFKFEGTLNRLYFKYLPVEQPAFVGSTDDD